ncbi:hypothetical protein E2562_001953 [Oryza meyeriana var. granulata]|uniref:Uncharacterized protein n=1 Tax=Oryza meyeriana var. granulata TaxID=110450 RepID=A0A6G1C391_9ORYZ|nr:hypothetical protein E2562_001953 [Oryza meyeriana var. granulata]
MAKSGERRCQRQEGTEANHRSCLDAREAERWWLATRSPMAAVRESHGIQCPIAYGEAGRGEE